MIISKITILITLILTTTTVSAFNTDFLSSSVISELDVGVANGDNGDANTGFALRAQIILEARVSDTVRAVIVGEVFDGLLANGERLMPDVVATKIEAFIREAHIDINMVNGIPMAFIIGKQEIAFGQNYTGLAMNSRGANSKTSLISRVDGVVGMTVKLDTNFFGLIDSIEGSIFENQEGDLSVGELNNYSIRIGSDLTENIRMTASFMNRDLGLPERTDTGSLGFIYNKEEWTAHIEGLAIIDNSGIMETIRAYNAGISYDIGAGVISVEYSWIENSLSELGLSYETEITENVTIGPQINHNLDTNETFLGARLTFKKKLKVGKKTKTIL
jgi:hypothetical protein